MKNSVDFWHRKLTLMLNFWYFLTTIFDHLTSLINLIKKECTFYNKCNLGFSLKCFHQIPLAWWKIYQPHGNINIRCLHNKIGLDFARHWTWCRHVTWLVPLNLLDKERIVLTKEFADNFWIPLQKECHLIFCLF